MNDTWLSMSYDYQKSQNKLLVMIKEHVRYSGSRWPKTNIVAAKSFWVPAWGHGWFWTLQGLHKKIEKFHEKTLHDYTSNCMGWNAIEQIAALTVNDFGQKKVKKNTGMIVIC